MSQISYFSLKNYFNTKLLLSIIFKHAWDKIKFYYPNSLMVINWQVKWKSRGIKVKPVLRGWDLYRPWALKIFGLNPFDRLNFIWDIRNKTLFFHFILKHFLEQTNYKPKGFFHKSYLEFNLSLKLLLRMLYQDKERKYNHWWLYYSK